MTKQHSLSVTSKNVFQPTIQKVWELQSLRERNTEISHKNSGTKITVYQSGRKAKVWLSCLWNRLTNLYSSCNECCSTINLNVYRRFWSFKFHKIATNLIIKKKPSSSKKSLTHSNILTYFANFNVISTSAFVVTLSWLITIWKSGASSTGSRGYRL